MLRRLQRYPRTPTSLRARTAATDLHLGCIPALIAMLRELPRAGTEWPKGKKERFMTAFRSILDVVYPEPEGSP